MLIYENRSLGTEITTIIVGSKREEFKIHTSILRTVSRVLNERIPQQKLDLVKNEELILRQPKDDPRQWSALVEWAYRSSLPALPGFDQDDNDDKKVRGAWLTFYFDLFIFAEDLSINQLADKIMDRIQDLIMHMTWGVGNNELVHTHPIKLLYEDTRRGSKLRAFVIESMVYRCFDIHHRCMPKEALILGDLELENITVWDDLHIFKDFLKEFQKYSKDKLPTKPSKRSNHTKSITNNFKRNGSCYFHSHTGRLECCLKIGEQK